MSFTAQIGQLTGSASSNDATTIAQTLENATAEFIQKISQINPDLLYSMASESNITNNDDGNLEFDKNSIILNVYRSFSSKKYNATRIDIKYQTQVQDTDSIYYADDLTPVYVFDGSKIQIYPAPDNSSGKTAYVTRVVPGAINDNSETIANMPSLYHPQIVRIASYNVLLQRLGSLRDTMYTEYNDAINKAKSLVDDASGLTTGTEDVEYWLKEEDPEMISSTLSTASQEIQRASAIAGKFNSDYQWMQNQLALIKQEINETYQGYSSAPVQTDIGRLGVGT
tara:strand:- start:2248 stop:3096 length:849 start_codon:yes stop_codon:yes gene_type:complete